jgi:O-Antigen ligase
VALVGIKGLSMTWTISETETVKEILRSSMYLATFLTALAALSSGRQVGPLIDIAVLMVAAVAGYGILQKISPVQYPVGSLDNVRVDSTLNYANTTAMILGMGVVLALARMTRMRNAALRGLYAVLALAFFVTLYLTLSRGGIGSLGMGLVVLFVLANSRLQMLTNLLLLSVPGVWLLWRMQDLEALVRAGASEQQKVAAGVAFRTDLILALAVAFVLQAGYALLVNRYELQPQGRRLLGALVLVGAVLACGAGAFAVVSHYGGVEQAYETLLSNPEQTETASRRLASLSIGHRGGYWEVAWEEWKEHPLRGTGAGTFHYTWLQERSGTNDVRQVHNLFLEQGTETGVFAFLALAGFAAALVGYTARAAWRSGERGERRLLLSGLVSALVVYLVSSAFEWHWYLPASTLFFFVLAAITVKFAAREDWGASEADARTAGGDDGFQSGRVDSVR